MASSNFGRFNSNLRAPAAAAAIVAAACSATTPPADTGPAPQGSPTTSVTASPAPLSSPPPSAPPSPSPPAIVDAGAPDTGPVTADDCFKTLKGPVKGPDYDQFKPVMGKKCTGTQHQRIKGVQKLVFLGDSVTTGTPPNLPAQYYRSIVTDEAQKRFGPLEVKDCSGWGARTDDFIDGRNQIGTCFPTTPEPKTTLVVFTMGGNDIDKWAQDKLSTAAASAEADKAAQYQRDAVTWLKDPQHFPNGSYVIFGNVYEYTDTSGDLLSCPTALVAGLSGTYAQGAPAIVHFQEELMKVAVDTGTDMIFMLEQFCGHGYHRGDSKLQCYRGANAPLWFDLTCIHPNPDGHRAIANMFLDVIDG